MSNSNEGCCEPVKVKQKAIDTIIVNLLNLNDRLGGIDDNLYNLANRTVRPIVEEGCEDNPCKEAPSADNTLARIDDDLMAGHRYLDSIDRSLRRLNDDL
jgi:hypothetical protein